MILSVHDTERMHTNQHLTADKQNVHEYSISSPVVLPRKQVVVLPRKQVVVLPRKWVVVLPR